MRRLPNTYPGNTTLYPTGRGTIGIGAPDAGSKVLFYNETPVNLDLDFYNGNTDVLHAWEANFWTLDGEVGDITWAIDTDSLAVVNPPINAVFTTLLNPEEKLNDKAYPMPLIRQIGGQQAIVSSASQTINDGNALQQVVEATLQGHASSDVIINNDGSFTLKGAGLLAAVGILTHILGTLTVDQATTLSNTLAVLGASSLDNGTITTNGTGTIAAAAVKSNTFRDNSTGGDQLDLSSTGVTVNGTSLLKGISTHQALVTLAAAGFTAPAATNIAVNTPTGQKISLQINGVEMADLLNGSTTTQHFYGVPTGSKHTFNIGASAIIDVKSTGIGLYGGTNIGLLTGSIARIAGALNTVCGSGTIITHGLGVTPTRLVMTPNIAQAGSATVGCGAIGATTFTATVGAGTALSWLAIA